MEQYILYVTNLVEPKKIYDIVYKENLDVSIDNCINKRFEELVNENKEKLNIYIENIKIMEFIIEKNGTETRIIKKYKKLLPGWIYNGKEILDEVMFSVDSISISKEMYEKIGEPRVSKNYITELKSKLNSSNCGLKNTNTRNNMLMQIKSRLYHSKLDEILPSSLRKFITEKEKILSTQLKNYNDYLILSLQFVEKFIKNEGNSTVSHDLIHFD